MSLKRDGRMTCDFTSFSTVTVFQSYQDDFKAGIVSVRRDLYVLVGYGDAAK